MDFNKPANNNNVPLTSIAAISLNYALESQKIKDFLLTFQDLADVTEDPGFKYKNIFNDIADSETKSITIDLDDIVKFDGDEDGFSQLCTNIETNAKRYVKLFADVIDKEIIRNIGKPTEDTEPLDVIMYQRMEKNQAAAQPDAELQNGPVDMSKQFPPILTRQFSVFFKPRSTVKPVSVREVKGTDVGHLVTIRGIATRTSNVKPLAVVLCLSCDSCGSEIFQEVTSKEFMPLTSCISDVCKKNNTKGKLYMQTRASKFLKFQEVKIQELTEQVPMGHIPRTMTLHLYEDLVRTLSPGDNVVVTGIWLPTPYEGYKAMSAGLIADTYLEVHHVEKVKKQYSQMKLDYPLVSRIEELVRGGNLYTKLARSIAPEIYGHDDVKKALLLLLVGGTNRHMPDGMKIRGDINICLMGDPGVAKSQLLKYISKIAPRGVYTTGRGSSGVGLTASVNRDPVTDEMVLEGGALVMADGGVACIDEFDKMDEGDRTAIHEVMEQQTISISKAGITTTLNARTSILAAANPQFGRYNPRMKATENINLPAALLSRFDLLFLILDRQNQDDDHRLASHVTYVHMHGTHPPRDQDDEVVDVELMREYIAFSRQFNPVLTKEVVDFVVNSYVTLRKNDEAKEFQYISARTLLSIIRMATALARLRFSAEVDTPDVDEALRLMDVSKASLLVRDRMKVDPKSAIFEIIRDMSRRADGSLMLEVPYNKIYSRVITNGFTDNQLEACIRDYSKDDIWMVDGNRSKLVWLRIEDEDSDEED
ncbi:Mcm2-7 hexameric complex component [Nowakowskiella sp. JEL0407]|nr:Mcm2-7 hexameric complex component [Nowakowskiella sp. JEL0407]